MNKRNELLDFFKAISAIGVIFVHFRLPGVLGNVLCSVGLVGVIFFFFISGYQTYSADGSSCTKIKVRFFRNLRITLFAIAIYVVYMIFENLILGTFRQWISNYANPVIWLRMIILGDFDLIYGDHFWYMIAMLYGYLIILCMEKYRLHKIFYALLPILFLLRIGVETYINSFFDVSWMNWHMASNFLAGALPIMLLGNFIASHKEKMMNANTKFFIVGMLVSFLLVFVFSNIRIRVLDISQPFKIAAAFFAFMTCLKLPEVHISSFMELVGRKYSLNIYLYHKLVGAVFCLLLTLLGGTAFIYEWILPIAVVFASVLVSFVMCPHL